ncbi:macro domain-containing protein [Nanoarchaeota archaeon]
MKIKIVYETGYAINKKVHVVVNSANGFLLLGTSGAGAIREKSQRLTQKEKAEYSRILSKLPARIRNDYVRVFKDQSWVPTYAQLGCLKLLLVKKGNEFKRGDAVLQESWSRKDDRKIVHAVSMSYKLGLHSSRRVPGTEANIRKAVERSLKIADSLGAQSVAMPVMAARPSYGMTPARSFRAISDTIKKYDSKNIQKVVVCFDNKITKGYLRKLKA